MSLLIHCTDGPLEGASFTVERCPKVVRCVLALDGTTDILNEPDDAPRLDEVAHWYHWDGTPAGFLCSRGRGREHGCHHIVHLTYLSPTARLRRDHVPTPEAMGAVK